MSERKAEVAKQKEDERDREYSKEQAMHDVRGFALMTKGESAIAMQRHKLNFMYDPPPGMERGRLA